MNKELYELMSFLIKNNEKDYAHMVASLIKNANKIMSREELMASQKLEGKLQYMIRHIAKDMLGFENNDDIDEFTESVYHEVYDFVSEFILNCSSNFGLENKIDLNEEAEDMSAYWLFLNYDLKPIVLHALRQGGLISGDHDIEDSDYISSIFAEYFSYQEYALPRDKNIYMIKSLDDIKKASEAAEVRYNNYIRSSLVKQDDNLVWIFENEDWKVCEAHSYFAAVKAGWGTKWCTTDRVNGEADFMNHYRPDSPLVIFMSKNNPKEKYQATYWENAFHDAEGNPVRDKYKIYNLSKLIADRPYVDLNAIKNRLGIDVGGGYVSSEKINP